MAEKTIYVLASASDRYDVPQIIAAVEDLAEAEQWKRASNPELCLYRSYHVVKVWERGGVAKWISADTPAKECGHCGLSIPDGEEVSSCAGDSHEACRARCETCN